jgi:hypothetical protein
MYYILQQLLLANQHVILPTPPTTKRQWALQLLAGTLPGYLITVLQSTLTTTKLFTIMIGRMPSPLDASSASTQPSTPMVIEPGINISAVSTYKIESLKDDNWVTWSSHMTTILKFQSAYSHVQGTVPKPDDPAQLQKWEQRDLLAQILIKK